MIFVMERTFLSWWGQYFCVCEIAVNKEKLSDVNQDLKHFHTHSFQMSCRTIKAVIMSSTKLS